MNKNIFGLVIYFLLLFSCQKDKVIETHETSVKFADSEMNIIVEKHKKTTTVVHLFDGNFLIHNDLKFNPSLRTTDIQTYFTVREAIGKRKLSNSIIISVDDKTTCQEISKTISMVYSKNKNHYAILMDKKIVSVSHILENGLGFSIGTDDSLFGKPSQQLNLESFSSSQDLALQVLQGKMKLSERSKIETFAESVRLEPSNSKLHAQVIEFWPGHLANLIVNKEYIQKLNPSLKKQLISKTEKAIQSEFSARVASKIIFDLDDSELLTQADKYYDGYLPSDFAVKYASERMQQSKNYLNANRKDLFAKKITFVSKNCETFEANESAFQELVTLNNDEYTEKLMQMLEKMEDDRLQNQVLKDILMKEACSKFNVLLTYSKREENFKMKMIEAAKLAYAKNPSTYLMYFLTQELSCTDLKTFAQEHPSEDLKAEMGRKCN